MLEDGVTERGLGEPTTGDGPVGELEAGPVGIGHRETVGVAETDASSGRLSSSPPDGGDRTEPTYVRLIAILGEPPFAWD
nr:hypothetical protein [Actinomadura rubteroloni]